MHSVVFGALAGVICFVAIEAKFRFGFDDSLDVVGIHFLGGAVGGSLLGFRADSSAVPGGDFANGVFCGGGILLWNQILSIAVVTAFSFGATYIIAKVMDKTIGLRVTESTEMTGLDVSDHGESACVMEPEPPQKYFHEVRRSRRHWGQITNHSIPLRPGQQARIEPKSMRACYVSSRDKRQRRPRAVCSTTVATNTRLNGSDSSATRSLATVRARRTIPAHRGSR